MTFSTYLKHFKRFSLMNKWIMQQPRLSQQKAFAA